MIDLRDLSPSAHERGELTAYEALCLAADWHKAGQPEDLLEFLGTHPTWRDVPVYFVLNTFRTPVDNDVQD